MIGIFMGFVLFVTLICLQINIVFAAPFASALIAWLNGVSVYDILSGPYVLALSDFIQKYIFIFLLSSILGKTMEKSGDGKRIGLFITRVVGKKQAALGIFLTSGLMNYCGIDGFIIIYTVYVIACAAFSQAGLPRSFIIASIAAGTLVVGLNVPGTALIHNLILMEHFGTPPTAGLAVGLASAFSGISFVVCFLRRQTVKYLSQPASPGSEELTPSDAKENPDDTLSLLKAFVPFISVIITLTILKLPPVLAIGSGAFLSLLLNMKTVSFRQTLNESISNALLPLFYAASIMGFGQVLSQIPQFSSLMDYILTLPYNPYVLVSIITNIAAGLTGSAAGGLLLVLGTVGDKLLVMGDPQLMHRIIIQASTVLDTLPHNAAYLAMLAYTGLKFRETYRDYFFVTVIAPFIGLVTANILVYVFY